MYSSQQYCSQVTMAVNIASPGTSPSCVFTFHPSELLHLYTLSQQLHSSAGTRVFRISSFRTRSSGQCSFSYQATATWNQLPFSVHRVLHQFLFYLVFQFFLEYVSLFRNLFHSPTALRQERGRQTDRHRQTVRQTDSQTDRQTQADRHRQTDTQTDTQTDRQRMCAFTLCC